jgi:hypothetical protein
VIFITSFNDAEDEVKGFAPGIGDQVNSNNSNLRWRGINGLKGQK